MITKYINKLFCGCLLGFGLLASLTSCEEKDFTTGMPEAKLISQIDLKVSSTLPVAVGMDTTIVCNVYPQDADNTNLLWTTSDELVAYVSNDGTITGLREGTAIITVTPELGFGVLGQTQHSIIVNVVPEIIKATAIVFTNTTTEVYETDQLQLTYDILPANHTYNHLLWKSSNEQIATVDENGVVTGVQKGTATIYAYATDKSGVVGTIDITVKGYVAAQEVRITAPASDQMYLGQDLMLEYAYTPEDATASTVVWESSDETVIHVVSAGRVKGVGFGTAVITATCTETGYKSSVSLTVATGWYVWDNNTDFNGWYSPTSGAKVEQKNGRMVVTVGTGNRADLKRQGTFETDFGNYPVLAMRVQDVGATYGSDFVTTKEYSLPNGITAHSATCKPIDLGDGTLLVYIVVTKPEVLNGMVPYRQFGFKVTKIAAAHTTYDVFWIRAFKSEAEMKQFVGIN